MALFPRSFRRRRSGTSFSHVAAFLLGMIAATMLLTAFHGSILHATHDLEHFTENQFSLDNALKSQMAVIPQSKLHISTNDEHHAIHGVAGLDCAAHGGPNSKATTQELVYWKDLPLDNDYISPLKSMDQRQYLTFEPDGGKLQ